MRKSSRGRHLIETTGNRCRLARVTHLRSCRLSSVTEWSEATEQMHFRIRGWKLERI